ncbi:MAG: hypothetical protein WC495_01750 [Patescibacteria group bacterium]
MQHELPLRRWLKPKLRKAQSRNCPGIHQVDNLPTIHAIAGETVWVPGQNAQWFLAGFNKGKHIPEGVSPRNLCAFRLRKLLDNGNAFAGGEFPQFNKLGLNGHNLLVIILGALASVEHAVQFWFEPYHIVFAPSGSSPAKRCRSFVFGEQNISPAHSAGAQF